MWFLYALLSAISAAFVAFFSKLGLKNIDPTLATTVRSIIMAVFLILVSFSLKKFTDFSLQTFSSKDWVLIILAGIAGAVSWLFYFMAIKAGDTTKVVAIDKMSLVFVALLAFLFLGENLKWQGILGIFLMVIGTILVSIF